MQTATLTSANNYALTTLYRGLYGSAIAAHSSGAQFARLDNAVFKYDLPAQYVGRTLYIKLQSFNVFGGGVEDALGLRRLHLHADRRRLSIIRSPSDRWSAAAPGYRDRSPAAVGPRGRLRHAVHVDGRASMLDLGTA